MIPASLQSSLAGLRGRRGIALVSVLWVLVLLSLIAASFSRTTRTEVEFARNLVENAKAEALADAGVYRAIIGVSEPLESDKWLTNGTPYEVTFPGGEVRVTVQDEVGKIDLNETQDSLLQGLFTLAGVEPRDAWDLVDSIVDFRDTDHLAEANGAEDKDYKAAGLPHDAKDAAFESVEELRQVMGMTYDLYEKVAPLLTVHSRRPGFNPNFAPKEVLLSLPGVGDEKVNEFLDERTLFDDKKIEAQRQQEDALASGDDGLSKDDGLGEKDESLLEGSDEDLLNILSEAPEISRFFTLGRSRGTMTVRAEARTASGGVFIREALVQIRRGRLENIQFLNWRRGAGVELLPADDEAEDLDLEEQ
jgi:general secretion pathway protein K